MEYTTSNKRCQSDCSPLYKSNCTIQRNSSNVTSLALFRDSRLGNAVDIDDHDPPHKSHRAHTDTVSLTEWTSLILNNEQSHGPPLLSYVRPLYSEGLYSYQQSRTFFLRPVPRSYKPPSPPAYQMSQPPGGLVRSSPPTYSTAVFLQSWLPEDSARCWPSTVRGRRRPSTQLPLPPQSTSLCHHLSRR